MRIHYVKDREMNIREYSKILDKFFSGSSSAEDNRLLRDMPEEEMETLFDEYARNKWENRSREMPEDVRLRIKAELLRKIHDRDSGTGKLDASGRTSDRENGGARTGIFSRRSRKLPKHILVRTAVAAGICLAAVLGYAVSEYGREPQTFEVIADRGQKSSVTLPDGTAVTLNSASRITWRSDYNRKNRTVGLEGEAYFEVAKNEKVPFTVRTDKMDITALGTEFDVKAYEEDRHVTATLVKGSIRADFDGQSEILVPDQYIVVDKTTGKSEVVTAENPEYLVPWKNDELLFAGETLEEIALILERMYDMEVVFMDEAAKDFSYTGLIRNSSLHNVLELISGTSPVRYTISGNVIAFSDAD